MYGGPPSLKEQQKSPKVKSQKYLSEKLFTDDCTLLFFLARTTIECVLCLGWGRDWLNYTPNFFL